MLDERNVTEKIASEDKGDHPGNAACNIISNETPVCHAPDAGYKGCKGPYNRNKPSDNDCLSAVFFIELVGAVKVFFSL